MRISSTRFLFNTLIIIWLIGALNWLTDYQLNRFGILPRSPAHLLGILSTPFLHGGFYHLLNNSIAFISLGFLVSLYNESRRNLLIKLTLFVAFWGGLLTWILGRPHIHVGLSGVIFGYWGFLTINGLIERSAKSIFLSLLAILLYGGMVFGIFPHSPMVSFESHLFGALTGIAYSLLCKTKGRKK